VEVGRISFAQEIWTPAALEPTISSVDSIDSVVVVVVVVVVVDPRSEVSSEVSYTVALPVALLVALSSVEDLAAAVALPDALDED